jgi:selenocysteine-specific elongation factor
MKVLGTAGHVDHGKSALVTALTGINPDRLQEEIDRQMTIDLGFAWMTMSDGEEVGIVDVPGHRDFIENMLAGVTGFDAALLVIAADEGIMPQTREHLAILDLLEVDQCVVALTKIDLIEDDDWLELIAEDIDKVLEDTSLSGAPIVPVSAKTGEGLDQLRDELGKALSKASPRVDMGKPRLPVDRAFTISGFGTIVTGTLQGGAFEVGQEVEILPGPTTGRIRGLQTHKNKVPVALPGSRTAVNISGVDVGAITRGDVVSIPKTYDVTTMIDVSYRHLKQVDAPLKHDQRVKVFIGAAQRVARVRVLGVEEILPGQDGFLQLMINEPLVAERGDHFIMRRPSPGLTLGGGRVIDAAPKARHRRFEIEVINSFENLIRGEPQDLVLHALTRGKFLTVKAIIKELGDVDGGAIEVINLAISKGDVVTLGDDVGELKDDDLLVSEGTWQNIIATTERTMNNFHDQLPLRFGMSREELKSRLGISGQIYTQVLRKLADTGVLEISEVNVSRLDYRPELDMEQNQLVSDLLDLFKKNPYSTPSVKECKTRIGNDLYMFLIESGQLLQVSQDVVFQVVDYQDMVAKIEQRIVEANSLAVAEVRDMFDTTRKYALALMEHLDEVGVTVRDGDVRRLAPNTGKS